MDVIQHTVCPTKTLRIFPEIMSTKCIRTSYVSVKINHFFFDIFDKFIQGLIYNIFYGYFNVSNFYFH
jgi:hypothetical protein